MINLIITPKGKAKNVTNLEWLIRHGKEVNNLTFVRLNLLDANNIGQDDGMIFATLNNGTKFICTFACEQVFKGWMKRNRTMKHLRRQPDSNNNIIYQ